MSINKDQNRVDKPENLIVVWLLTWNKAGYNGPYSNL